MQPSSEHVLGGTGGLFCLAFLMCFVLSGNATLYIFCAPLPRKFFISSQKSSPAILSYTEGAEPYSEHLLLLCLAAAFDAFAKGSNNV